MTGLQTVAIAVASLATAEGGALLTGYLSGRRVQITQSWIDGRDWVAARHAQAGQVDARRIMRRLAVWVLARLLRPRGQHRAEVAS